MGQSPQPVPLLLPQPQVVTLDLKRIFQGNKPPGSKALIEAMAAERKSTVICLYFADFLPANPMLADDVVIQLEHVLLAMGKVNSLDIFLRSSGGVAETPWRIISILRSFTKKLGVIVPRRAMSGATHIAIGADDLIMGPLSALGSVDPSRNHPLLPRDPQGNLIPVSVQDLKHWLEFVKRTLPREPVAPIVSQFFSTLNPLGLGALEQSYELARLISKKVLHTRNKKLAEDHIAAIVEQLAGKYYSHSYPISRDEVETDLRLPVTKAELGTDLFSRMEELNGYYQGLFEKPIAVPGTPVPVTFRTTAFVESTTTRRILCQVAGPDGRAHGGEWMSEQNT